MQLSTVHNSGTAMSICWFNLICSILLLVNYFVYFQLVLHRSWILFLQRMVLSLTSTCCPISMVDGFTLLCLSYFCLRIATFCQFFCQFLCSSSVCTSQFLLMSGDPGTWFLTLCLVQLNQSALIRTSNRMGNNQL